MNFSDAILSIFLKVTHWNKNMIVRSEENKKHMITYTENIRGKSFRCNIYL